MTPAPLRRLGRRAVAATLAVTTLAACSGGSAGDGPLQVTGTDMLQFEPDQLTAQPGSVTIELTSEDEVEHTVTIEELDDREVVAADAGETAAGTVDLDAGVYTFYCDVEGHRSAGMEGTLTVSD